MTAIRKEFDSLGEVGLKVESMSTTPLVDWNAVRTSRAVRSRSAAEGP